MPSFIKPREIIERLPELSDQQIAEMYSLLWQRAVDTNPLREWIFRVNPTREDLTEILKVLPPRDMSDLDLMYFS